MRTFEKDDLDVRAGRKMRFAMAPGERADDGGEAVREEMAQLYSEHAAILYRYGLLVSGSREAAQDAVQEAFLRYFRMRRAGQEIPNPKPWLFRVLRNHILDQWRVQQTRAEIGLEDLGQAADPAPDPERLCRGSELSRSLAAFLSPRELECLRLRAEGLRYAEIGEVLGISSGTVGALLARVHQKLHRSGLESWAERGDRGDSGGEEPYAS